MAKSFGEYVALVSKNLTIATSALLLTKSMKIAEPSPLDVLTPSALTVPITLPPRS